MALRGEVIDFIWLDAVQQFNQVSRVRYIAVVKKKLYVVDMRILIEVLDALCVERRRAANDTMDFVPLIEKEFGKIGSVLTRNSCDESFLHFLRMPFGESDVTAIS